MPLARGIVLSKSPTSVSLLSLSYFRFGCMYSFRLQCTSTCFWAAILGSEKSCSYAVMVE